MDFVRSVIDPRGALFPEEEREDRIVGNAERAVTLDGTVHDALHDVCREVLDHRDFLAGRAETVLFDTPGDLQDEGAGCLDLRRGIRDPVLDGSHGGQGRAGLDLPVRGPANHFVQGPAANAQPAHAVMDPARTEAFLGHRETRSAGAEQA